MKLMFIKIAGMLFCGMVDDSDKVLIHSPRIIFANQETKMLSLSEAVGAPSVIEIIGVPDYMYANEDSSFELFYNNEITATPAEEEPHH